MHVTSYLRKSADFCGNHSRISMKVCVKIYGLPWKSVRKFADCLWWARGIVFWYPRNRLSGICGIVFQAPTDSSCGSQTIFGRPQVIESAKSFSGVSKIVLWNCKSCINCCAISFERSAATLQWIIPQVHTEVPRIPSNVSAYSLRWFRKRFTEVRKLLRGILRKTYTANPRNSVTNLWHVTLHDTWHYHLCIHDLVLGSYIAVMRFKHEGKDDNEKL